MRGFSLVTMRTHSHEVLLRTFNPITGLGFTRLHVEAPSADAAEVEAISFLPECFDLLDRCVVRTYPDGSRVILRKWRNVH